MVVVVVDFGVEVPTTVERGVDGVVRPLSWRGASVGEGRPDRRGWDTAAHPDAATASAARTVRVLDQSPNRGECDPHADAPSVNTFDPRLLRVPWITGLSHDANWRPP